MYNRKAIAILPMEIAGYCANLANGLRLNGKSVYDVQIKNHPFLYSKDEEKSILSELSRICREINDWRWIGRYFSMPFRFLIVIYLLLRCSNIIMVFGQSLLPLGLDLYIFKLFNVKIVSVFLGSDSRPPYMNGKYDFHEDLYLLRSSVVKVFDRVRKLDKLSDIVIDNPISGIFHERPIVSWFDIGFPIQPQSCIRRQFMREGKLKIIHCPSHRKVKGSDEIKNVVQSLRLNGLDIEYKEYNGVSNETVTNAINEADLAIDQLYSDTPLPGFASECVARGLPVIVGTNSYELLSRIFNSKGIKIPSLLIQPELLKEKIQSIYLNPQILSDASEYGLAFVDKFWSSEFVARNMLNCINGEFGLIEPAVLSDGFGCGLSKASISKIYNSYYSEYGFDGFMLNERSPVIGEIKNIMVGDFRG